jgi:HlyD family secretion protein
MIAGGAGPGRPFEGQPIEALLGRCRGSRHRGLLGPPVARTLELQQSSFARPCAIACRSPDDRGAISADEAARVQPVTALLREQGSASQAAADQALAAATSATARVTVAAQSLKAAALAWLRAAGHLALQLARTEVSPLAGEIIARNAQPAIATAAGSMSC